MEIFTILLYVILSFAIVTVYKLIIKPLFKMYLYKLKYSKNTLTYFYPLLGLTK